MSIHGSKLRWLFWLRWTLLQRQVRRGPGRFARITGLIVLFVIFLSFGLTSAVTVYVFC